MVQAAAARQKQLDVDKGSSLNQNSLNGAYLHNPSFSYPQNKSMPVSKVGSQHNSPSSLRAAIASQGSHVPHPGPNQLNMQGPQANKQMMMVSSKSNQNSPQKNKMSQMANNSIYNQQATSKHPILAIKQHKM